MSTLTKILVVVGVVLSVFASTVFINLAASQPNFRKWGEGEYRRAEGNWAQAQSYAAQMNTLQGQYDDLAKRNSEGTQRSADNERTLNDQVAQLQTELAQERNTVANLTANMAQKEAVQSQLVAMQQQLQKQFEDRGKTIMTLNTQNAQFEQRLKEFSLDVERAVAQIRYLEEEVATVTQKYNEAITGKGTAGGQAPGTANKIDGSVLSVQGDLAQLNVGSAQGVTKGMRFTVYRGPEFVAHLDIQAVGASNSSGVLVDVQKAPQQGDKATNTTK